MEYTRRPGAEELTYALASSVRAGRPGGDGAVVGLLLLLLSPLQEVLRACL
jgi:hypothetical protein